MTQHSFLFFYSEKTLKRHLRIPIRSEWDSVVFWSTLLWRQHRFFYLNKTLKFHLRVPYRSEHPLGLSMTPSFFGPHDSDVSVVFWVTRTQRRRWNVISESRLGRSETASFFGPHDSDVYVIFWVIRTQRRRWNAISGPRFRQKNSKETLKRYLWVPFRSECDSVFWFTWLGRQRRFWVISTQRRSFNTISESP